MKNTEFEKNKFVLVEDATYMYEKKYYKRLDIIRTISCIIVFLYHLNIMKGGFLAVCTFFALSRLFKLNIGVK